MKRSIVFLTALFLIFTAKSSLAESNTEYTTGDYTYRILEDGTAEIANYTGDENDLIIPSELDHTAVTSIGESAFFKCNCLKNVKIPDGVTAIRDFAFCNSENLITITLPDSVTTMGQNVFEGCRTLRTLVLPKHLEAVQFALCWNCRALTQVFIPGGVTGIGADAFGSCDRLHDIYFGGTEEEWNSLEKYGINNNFGYTSIGRVHFNSVPTDVEEIIESGDFLYRLNGSNEAVIETYLNITENRALEGDKELLIPPSIDGYPVTEISALAITECYSSSVDIIIIPDGVTKIGNGAFKSCGIDIKLPESLEEIGDFAFSGCDLGDLILPDGLRSIGPYAFSYCRGITELTIPDSVISIGDYAFSGCKNLKDISIPDSELTIGNHAFSDTGLTSTAIPDHAL